MDAVSKLSILGNHVLYILKYLFIVHGSRKKKTPKEWEGGKSPPKKALAKTVSMLKTL